MIETVDAVIQAIDIMLKASTTNDSAEGNRLIKHNVIAPVNASQPPQRTAVNPSLRSLLLFISCRRIVTQILSRSWGAILLLVVWGTAALLPAMIYGIPSGPDLPEHFRNALSFNEALRSGHSYPGWRFDSNGGYGDASFRVYPPGLLYLLSAAHALTGDWYVGSLLAFTLISMAGCLGVYFWACSLYPRHLALWAGVFYAFTPFHINELYQGALLAEFAGAAALAFVFGFAERVCRRGRMRDVAGLAAAAAILIFTHPPLAMMGSLALFIYASLRMGRRSYWRGWIKLLLALALGLGASSCYWTTLAAEMAWVKGDTIRPGMRFDYRRNFLFATLSPEGLSEWWANVLALAMLAMLWPALAPSRSTGQDTHGSATRAVQLLMILSFLMATPISQPLWAIIPKLGSIEFPWRWLAVTSIIGAVALAACIPFWKEKAQARSRYLAICALGSVVIALAFTLSHPIRAANYLSRSDFAAMLQSLPGTAGLPEWLPVWAKEHMPSMSSEVEAGHRPVSIVSWEAERRIFQVAPGEATEARVHTFYYPLWVATAQGQILPTRPASDGALLVSLPAEAASVQLEFREPARACIAATVSVLAWMLLLILLALGWRHRRTADLTAPAG